MNLYPTKIRRYLYLICAAVLYFHSCIDPYSVDLPGDVSDILVVEALVGNVSTVRITQAFNIDEPVKVYATPVTNAKVSVEREDGGAA